MKIALQQAEEPPGAVADLVTALAMTGADVAQSELGLSGRGVKVAVIDTGIDYDHPDLGGCFGPRLPRRARASTSSATPSMPSSADPATTRCPRPIPIPTTATATARTSSGIIGANGGIKGVAPGVTFHAYRVFGCEGSTTADIMLAAMETALADGADVVNMSIGSALQWPQYPTAQAADRLVKHGVVVVASIGNEGALGLYGAVGAGRRQERHRRRVVRQLAREPRRLHDLARRRERSDTSPRPARRPRRLTGSFPMARTGTTTTDQRRLRGAAGRAA